MTGRTASTWTTPDDVTAKVRRQWQAGRLLASYCRGEPFEAIGVPIRGPRPTDAAADLDRVRSWIAALERGGRRRGRDCYRLEWRSLGGRVLGSNQVPARAWVENYEAAWTLLAVDADVATFTGLVDLTRDQRPEALGWVLEHPLQVLELDEAWPRLLATLDWLHAHVGEGLYLRQIDVPGVDTKFVEQHRRVLGELLAATGLVASGNGGTAKTAAWGFREKPRCVRVRGLDACGVLPQSLTESTLRVDELARLSPPVRRVVILENEITFLALPVPPESLVLLGAGYTGAHAGALPWLAEVEVVYWGDIDTHGFAILNRLRHHCPHVRSMLMDRATFLDHRALWGHEPSPTRAHLDRLTSAEQDLYADLVEDIFGPSLRLEQERLRWGLVEAALGRLS